MDIKGYVGGKIFVPPKREPASYRASPARCSYAHRCKHALWSVALVTPICLARNPGSFQAYRERHRPARFSQLRPASNPAPCEPNTRNRIFARYPSGCRFWLADAMIATTFWAIPTHLQIVHPLPRCYQTTIESHSYIATFFRY